jgi:hypothetical protein
MWAGMFFDFCVLEVKRNDHNQAGQAAVEAVIAHDQHGTLSALLMSSAACQIDKPDLAAEGIGHGIFRLISLLLDG